ncbi:DUF305 domain-containing protein [Nakamurella sp.]|uniref:DUF305 domain-containing protein n=1 Tax=Nakamurella sp. TaxID=1869182 RepID=UPI003784F377
MTRPTDPTSGSAAGPPGDVTTPRPGLSRPVTILLLVAAAVVLLLVGATLGLALSGAFRSEPATPDSSSVDAGFARDMIVHHDQGVLMAHYAEQNTQDPEIGVMAYDIGYTQTDQIGQMQGWLSLWDLPESTDAPRMGWMSGSQGGHDMGAMTSAAPTAAPTGATRATSAPSSAPATSAGETPLMPGMATNSEIARLQALRGTESDIYFLQLMIRHHQGGQPMMEYAAEHATNPVVRNFADKMAQSQSAEISVMTQMLAERGAEPLPAPAG